MVNDLRLKFSLIVKLLLGINKKPLPDIIEFKRFANLLGSCRVLQNNYTHLKEGIDIDCFGTISFSPGGTYAPNATLADI